MELADLVGRGGVVVLSGAGISTESGIPDYRGPSGAAARKHTPMTFQTFTRDEAARRRYWARGFLGWRGFASVSPNDGHHAVASLEGLGLVVGTITQNVDGLHQAAGSCAVVDLHGRLDRIVCLGCGTTTPRDVVHDRLTAANLDWSGTITAVNPDGDVDVPEEHLDGFTVVDCVECGGVLKPDVVYFGENVPAARVESAYSMLDGASLLLVLGTSLTVFSGRRFVTRAQRDGIDVAVVNDGPTRADDVARLKVEAPLGATLQALVASLREPATW